MSGRTKMIIDNIVTMEYAGALRAIGLVAVDKDGDIRVLFAFEEGTKLPLLGGTLVLQRDIMSSLKTITKDDDI